MNVRCNKHCNQNSTFGGTTIYLNCLEDPSVDNRLS